MCYGRSAFRLSISRCLLGRRSDVAIRLRPMHDRTIHPFGTVLGLIAGPFALRLEVRLVVGREAFNLLLAEAGFEIILMFGRSTNSLGRHKELLGTQPATCINDDVLNVSG